MISSFPSPLSKQTAFFLGNTEIFTYGRKEELREGGRGLGGGEVGRLKERREKGLHSSNLTDYFLKTWSTKRGPT